MGFWGPMILLFAEASISLALAVHRSWCRRERLRYPIAEFARMLISDGSETGSRSVFRDNLFWAGLLVLLLSSFLPIVYFGLLISLVLITTTLGALIVLPAVLAVLEKSRARTGSGSRL